MAGKIRINELHRNSQGHLVRASRGIYLPISTVRERWSQVELMAKGRERRTEITTRSGGKEVVAVPNAGELRNGLEIPDDKIWHWSAHWMKRGKWMLTTPVPGARSERLPVAGRSIRRNQGLRCSIKPRSICQLWSKYGRKLVLNCSRSFFSVPRSHSARFLAGIPVLNVSWPPQNGMTVRKCLNNSSSRRSGAGKRKLGVYSASQYCQYCCRSFWLAGLMKTSTDVQEKISVTLGHRRVQWSKFRIHFVDRLQTVF